MAAAHLVFARNPNNHRGVIINESFQPLTLEGGEISFQSMNLAARVQIRYEYRNCTGAAQNVFAAFALIPKWDLCSMSCECGKQTITSKVAHAEKHERQANYADATFVPTVVTQAIPWSLLSLQTIVITAVFVIPFDVLDDGSLRATIPKQIFPIREEVPEAKAEFASFFNIPSTSKLPKVIFIGGKGTVNGTIPENPSCAGLNSSTMKFQSNILNDKKSYSFKMECVDKQLRIPDDITFTIPTAMDIAEPLHVHVCRENSSLVDNSNCFAVETTFSPPISSSVPNAEVIFLVDATTSMNVHKQSIIKALRIGVAGLPNSTFVNIMRYGAASGVPQPFFPKGSEMLTEATREAILDDYLPNLQFDLSGSSLYSAMRSVYEAPFITGYVRNVVLITDGGDAQYGSRIIEVARANTHSTRVSVVAVGKNACTEQLKLLASVTNGVYESGDPVTKSGSADAAAGALVSALNAVVVPTLTHVSLRFQSSDGSDGGPIIRQASALLPVLPVHRSIAAYGLAEESLKDFTAILSGLVAGQHCEYKYVCSGVREMKASQQTADVMTVSLAHVAAARARIRGLVDHNTRSTTTAAEDAEVSSLASNFSLPSPATQFTCTSNVSAGLGSAPMSAGYVPLKLYNSVPIPVAKDVSGQAVNPDILHAPSVDQGKAALANLSTNEFLARIVEDIVGLACFVEPNIENIVVSQKMDGSFSHLSARYLCGSGFSESFFHGRKPTWAEDDVWATALAVASLEKLESKAGTLALKKAKEFLTARNVKDAINAAKRTLA